MTTDLNTLAADLEAAKADLALWEKLTSAADRVKALTAAFDKARAAHDKAQAAQEKADREASYAGVTDVRVSGGIDHGACSGGLLRETFTISWMAPEYDMYSMTSPMKAHSRQGFRHVPDNVLACLIDKHPDRIPDRIMALAPGKPSEALGEYFAALGRGYIVGAAA